MTKTKKDLPEMYQRVLSVIPSGRSEAIPFKEIMTRIGAREQDERNIREVLSSLVTVYKQPVGCTSEGEYKGFYIVTSLEDFLFAQRTLKSRIKHMVSRDQALMEACMHILHPEFTEQSELESEEE